MEATQVENFPAPPGPSSGYSSTSEVDELPEIPELPELTSQDIKAEVVGEEEFSDLDVDLKLDEVKENESFDVPPELKTTLRGKRTIDVTKVEGAKKIKLDTDEKPSITIIPLNHTEKDAEEPPKEKEVETEEDKTAGNSSKIKNMRRNIREIMSEDKLDEQTLAAQREEQERRQRVNEQKNILIQQVLQKFKSRGISISIADTIRQAGLDNVPLQTEAPMRTIATPSSSQGIKEETVVKREVEWSNSGESDDNADSDSDVVLISSGDEDEDVKKKPAKDVVAVASSEEDDDCVMIADTGEDNDDSDPNNYGVHVNDTYNIPDDQGRVLANVGHPPDDPDVYIAPQIARELKPHQIGGIRFLYDNLVESLERYNNSSGFGCILAHSMGLGKTLQIVSFCDIFLQYTSGRSVVCIVPINTLQNWLAEFNHWLPVDPCSSLFAQFGEVKPRNFPLHVVNDSHKSLSARAKVIREWYKSGGVLLIGYELYRQLCLKKYQTKKKKRKTKNDIIDLEEEDRNKRLIDEIHFALTKPGPDLVVCDEGHRIKNSHASISQALKSIRTKRRVVLTGYPLQNNLIEYWCMVDFVRPNYLGTRTEFCNMFERPIQNGQCIDSTPKDKKLMRYRAHVLHSLLEGFVQRRSHSVLQSSLPHKEEYVLLIRLTPFQRNLYNSFMAEISRSPSVANPLKAFAVCCKIWNHPDILYNFLKKREEDFDLDLEDVANGSSKEKGNNADGSQVPPTMPLSHQSSSPALMPSPVPTPAEVPVSTKEKNDDNSISYDWALPLFKGYTPGLIENAAKMDIFFEILQRTVEIGDRLLLFSQSLFTLNLLEEFLQKADVPGRPVKWANNVNYFRLDGSTTAMEREKLIGEFNSNPEIHLFLISTRAGSLGINLVGANRVLVFDASWNPCHDTQAVCRVYRYGQQKRCFVYRIVTDNTLEKKIYDRQINKQGMANRVVDELNPQANFSSKEVSTLITFDEKDPDAADVSDSMKELYVDDVLNDVVKKYGKSLTKLPFHHESLLIDHKDKKLSAAEKRLAKRSYELEKQASLNYNRSSYNSYYPQMDSMGNPQMLPPNILANMRMPRGRGFMGQNMSKPIASVRPMQSELMARYPGTTNLNMRQPVISSSKPGISTYQITIPKDMVIPTSTRDGNSITLRQGQKIMVIKTQKGVYLRLNDGRLIAVRLPSTPGVQLSTASTSAQSPSKTLPQLPSNNMLFSSSSSNITDRGRTGITPHNDFNGMSSTVLSAGSSSVSGIGSMQQRKPSNVPLENMRTSLALALEQSEVNGTPPKPKMSDSSLDSLFSSVNAGLPSTSNVTSNTFSGQSANNWPQEQLWGSFSNSKDNSSLAVDSSTVTGASANSWNGSKPNIQTNYNFGSTETFPSTVATTSASTGSDSSRSQWEEGKLNYNQYMYNSGPNYGSFYPSGSYSSTNSYPNPPSYPYGGSYSYSGSNSGAQNSPYSYPYPNAGFYPPYGSSFSSNATNQVPGAPETYFGQQVTQPPPPSYTQHTASAFPNSSSSAYRPTSDFSDTNLYGNNMDSGMSGKP